MSESLSHGLLFLALITAAAPREAPLELTLARAVDLALAQSASAGQAVASRDEALAGQDLARDAFAPRVVVKATPGYASGLPVAVAGEVPAAAGIEIRQTIYDPSLRAEELESRARRAQAGATFDDATSAIVSRVAELYETVRVDQWRLAARTEILDSKTSLALRAAALASDGRVAPIDADRARLDADLAEASRAEIEATLSADSIEFGNLIGLRALPPLSDDPLEIVAEPDGNAPDLDADPTLSALGEAIELFGRSERAQSRLFAPTIAGDAQYLRLSDSFGYDKYFNNFKPDDFTVGIAIALPLWTGGAARDAVRRTRAERLELENRRRERREDLELARVRTRAGLALTRRRMELTKRARELSERDLARIQLLESDGRSGPDGVAKARISLAEAREAEAAAELAALRARLAALAAEGPLTPNRVGSIKARGQDVR